MRSVRLPPGTRREWMMGLMTGRTGAVMAMLFVAAVTTGCAGTNVARGYYAPMTATPASDPPSPRNRFPGTVSSVEVDGLVAIVEVQAGPFRFVSMLTRAAVDEHGIQVGSSVVCAVKATDVMVMTASRA